MGILISFSGIDGSGKSTQVKLLSKQLKSKGNKVYVTEIMFGYFLLKPLIKFFRSATGSPKKGPVTRNRNLLFKMWFVPAFIDIWLGHIFRIRHLTFKHDYVLADRFYSDIWANLLYYGYIPEWGFNSLVRFLPRADMALVFDVDPKNVRKREDDFPLSYYQEQSKIYKRLSKLLNLTVVNSNNSKKSVFAKILKIIPNLKQ